MKKTSAQMEILQFLSMMETSSRQKVLTFIKSLLKNQKKKKNHHAILQYAGAFNESDLHEMKSAIENGCEKNRQG
ncbi:MAG: hypothetical protein ABI855_00810 [Bacteroidota bacterium]